MCSHFLDVLWVYAVLGQSRGYLTGGCRSSSKSSQEKHFRSDVSWLDESRQLFYGSFHNSESGGCRSQISQDVFDADPNGQGKAE